MTYYFIKLKIQCDKMITCSYSFLKFVLHYTFFYYYLYWLTFFLWNIQLFLIYMGLNLYLQFTKIFWYTHFTNTVSHSHFIPHTHIKRIHTHGRNNAQPLYHFFILLKQWQPLLSHIPFHCKVCYWLLVQGTPSWPLPHLVAWSPHLHRLVSIPTVWTPRTKHCRILAHSFVNST